MRNKLSALVCSLLLITASAPALGQEPPDEVLLVRTRAVFIDALVRDKKTGEAVTDLKPENFRVLDDGKPRPLAYFSGGGAARKRPLALVLVLNLPKYVERPEVTEQIISALGALRPDDEVAVMQVWAERSGPRPLSFVYRSKMVLDLTRDREKTYSALREVQKFARRNRPEVEELLSVKAAMKAGWKDAIRNPDPTMQNPPFDITVAPDFEAIIDKAPLIAAKERPDSQVMIVESTDDDAAATYGQSKEITRRLLATGVTYNALVAKRGPFRKFVRFTGHVIAPLMGLRYEIATYYSRQTGVEVGRVGSPESFAAAVSRIISNLSARYSLGFTLTDADQDDGRLRKLEVKVKGRDARGRGRKFVVSARQGYYTSADALKTPQKAPAPGRVKNLSNLAGAR